MHRETARHAEVHEQNIAARQMRQEVLSPPLQPLDLAPAQPRGEILRAAEIARSGRCCSTRANDVAGERRLEAAPHDFDFGQLGHIGGYFASMAADDGQHSARAPA